MDQLGIYLTFGLKYTHLPVSLFPVHQYVNSKNAKDLYFFNQRDQHNAPREQRHF